MVLKGAVLSFHWWSRSKGEEKLGSAAAELSLRIVGSGGFRSARLNPGDSFRERGYAIHKESVIARGQELFTAMTIG